MLSFFSSRTPRSLLASFAAMALGLGACGKGTDKADPATDSGVAGTTWECVIPADSDPDFATQLGCYDDFDQLASDPLDASIPGARSVKTVVDRVDSDALYFQNSNRYQIHWEFAFEHLSGDGLPIVQELSVFNATEYTSPDRRFILGALTFYEEPAVWTYELSPYDTASAEMIETAYRKIRDNVYFGDELYFHPTSTSIEEEAEGLADDIKIITTEELFAGITYQPLNLATSMGYLTFLSTKDLEDEAAVNFREIVVLDAVPNDIGVVAGIITAEFQTPLSHINVLSQNRGTPNMALKGAMEEESLTSLEGKWVELTVEAMDWSIREVTQAEADAWWEANKPDPIVVTPMDTSSSALVEEEDILDLETYSLADAVTARVPMLGGKATHYGGFAHMDVPHAQAYVVPVYWYDKHMRDNDLWTVAEAMLADEEFQANASVRAEKLEALRDLIEAAPFDPELEALLTEQIQSGYDSGKYPSTRFRFRSSTNAEDVSGFNGAGLYTSKTGDPNDPDKPLADAVRKVWASVWSYRAYDEREYYSIKHLDIGMALLSARSYPEEEANGVAITANIYDTAGFEPAFYVNVQKGGESVVFPDAGVTTDQYLHYYDQTGSPVVYLGHSNLVDDGETVLTAAQVYALGTALKTIHTFWYDAYGEDGYAGSGFYAMDVEFKFDIPEGETTPQLYIKQARPYPGWNGAGD